MISNHKDICVPCPRQFCFCPEASEGRRQGGTFEFGTEVRNARITSNHKDISFGLLVNDLHSLLWSFVFSSKFVQRDLRVGGRAKPSNSVQKEGRAA